MLFKPTGSHSLQLCHLFGCCAVVLFSSAFQSHFVERSHTDKTDTGRKSTGANRFSDTQLFNREASPPRGAPSVPLPRP